MTSSPGLVDRPVPRQARSRERVDVICAAALEVLRRGGIAECTVAAIAAEARITPASLYRYFANVEAVLYAVATRQLDDTNERLDHALRDLRSRNHAQQVLLALLDDYEARFRGDAALRAIWAGTIAFDSLVELNVADSRRNGRLIAERVSPHLRRPVDPAQAFLVTHLVGGGVMLLLQLDDAEADRLRIGLRALLVSLLDDGGSAKRVCTDAPPAVHSRTNAGGGKGS